MKKLFYLSALLVLLLFSAGIVFAQADTVYVKALEQYEKGHYDKAIDLLKDFVSRRPEPSAYYLIGYALYKLKRFDEADDYFKQTYLIDPVFSPSTLEYFQKQSPEELEALEAFAKPSETGTQPQELVEVAPPVVEQEQAPASEPETAAPPTVAQTTPPQQAQPTAPATPPQEMQPATPATPPQEMQPAAPATPPQEMQPTAPATPPQEMQPATPPQQTRTSPSPYRPQQKPGMDIASGFLAMFVGGLMIVPLIISGVLYFFFAFCMFKIGKKLNVEMPWLAFIPIVQIWVFVASAGKPWWWILLLFVPIVNFFIGIYLWMCIAENLGKSKWLGLLMLVPVVNLVMLVIFAFSTGEGGGSMGGLTDFGDTGFDDSDLSSFVPPSSDDDDDTF